jgi:hypothetical protein
MSRKFLIFLIVIFLINLCSPKENEYDDQIKFLDNKFKDNLKKIRNLLISFTFTPITSVSYSPGLSVGTISFCRMNVMTDNKTIVFANAISQLLGLLGNAHYLYAADGSLTATFPVTSSKQTSGLAGHLKMFSANQLYLGNNIILTIQPDAGSSDKNTLYTWKYTGTGFTQNSSKTTVYGANMGTDSAVTADTKKLPLSTGYYIGSLVFVIKE